MNIVDIQHSFQHFSNCWANSNILHITNCDNKISKFYWTEIPGDLIKGKFHLWAKYEKHSKYPHLSWEVALCNPTWSDLAHQLPPKFAVFTQASKEGGRVQLGKARCQFGGKSSPRQCFVTTCGSVGHWALPCLFYCEKQRK